VAIAAGVLSGESKLGTWWGILILAAVVAFALWRYLGESGYFDGEVIIGPGESVPGRSPGKVAMGTAMIVAMIIGAVLVDSNPVVSVIAALVLGFGVRAIGAGVWAFASRRDLEV
jgi:hypothetical protein